MKREELLRSKEYIVSQIQLNLLNIIGEYKQSKNLKDYQLAEQLGVSKGYISQILNATFDHKISKVVDLAVACNKMPLLYFVDMDKFIKADSEDKIYDLMPSQRPKHVGYSGNTSDITSEGFTKVERGLFQSLPIVHDTSGNNVEMSTAPLDKSVFPNNYC